MDEPAFLSIEDAHFIHSQEIEAAGGEPNIRDEDGISACVDAPRASFGGEYLQNIFDNGRQLHFLFYDASSVH